MVKLVSVVAMIILAGSLVGLRPAVGQDDRPLGRASLFVRLGGISGITAVVDETLGRAGQDVRLRARFANANMFRLRNGLIEQLCVLSEGPCSYRGLDMRTAHRGMGITGEEFDALIEDLKAVLDQFRMPARDQKDLVALFVGTKSDVVERGTAAPPAAVVPPGPVTERAQSLREAAALLDRADGERRKGNRSLAEQMFSFAEMIVGADALASLANLFREGAPPRINTPTVAVSMTAPPQPQAAGNSDDEDPAPRPARGSLVGDLQAGGPAFGGFAIVTLEPTSGRFRQRQPRHRIIEQRNRAFAPHVMVVPVGSTVAFPNFDSIYHNVFSRSTAGPFDLGLYKAGQEREVRFDKPGVVRIGCNLHANMSAIVAVVSEPYYAVTDAHGHFAFRSLPPGNYRLRAYTEGSDEPQVQTVRILPERNTVAVALSLREQTGVLADNVFLAKFEGEAGFGRLVALKVLQPSFASHPVAVALFLDEARLVATLDHPNIVQTYDLGRAGDRYFIAMEYVDGTDLSRLLGALRRRNECVAVPYAIAILCRLCDGLHAAHTATGPDGVPLCLVHRDVKGANVFLARTGAIKIGDFGIAKATHALRTSRTESGQVKGTPDYMPPEQRLGLDVDPRTDIYGIGAVAYEMLSGRTVNLDLVALAAQGTVGWPHLPRLSSLRSDVPPELEEAVFKALAYDRNDRFADCASFEQALRATASSCGIASDKDLGAWVRAEINRPTAG